MRRWLMGLSRRRAPLDSGGRPRGRPAHRPRSHAQIRSGVGQGEHGQHGAAEQLYGLMFGAIRTPRRRPR
jgi:hypothetical protein